MAGAYTPPNNFAIPPVRTTPRSSIQSAPAAIPATTVVNFPAGFTPAELTRVAPRSTFSSISSDSPARSANAITGANPASDTNPPSSKPTVARDQMCDSFTESASRAGKDQDVHATPIFPARVGTFHVTAPTQDITNPLQLPRIEV